MKKNEFDIDISPLLKTPPKKELTEHEKRYKWGKKILTIGFIGVIIQLIIRIIIF